MARGLFLSLPAHGHINPTVGLVRELVARGENVTYYATDAFSSKIADVGAAYRPYRNPFLSDLRGLPEQTDELSWLLMRTSQEVLADELTDFRALRPDYIVTDSVAPWGQWAGALLGVPVVTSISTFAFNRHVMRYAYSSGVRPKSARRLLVKLRHVIRAALTGRTLRRRYGVRGPGVMHSVSGQSELNIVYTSRLFQPRAETFDARYQFIGPSLGERSSRPGSGLGAPPDLRPLVYVSLGTLFNAEPAFYRQCFEALAGLDVQAIVSVGTTVDRATLGAPPPNVTVADFVAQLDVLARASAFITHGGMNSASESLSAGVPMLVVPQMGEQAIVGRRVEELGAGLYLAKEAVTPTALRASLVQLLEDGRFRAGAATVRQSFESAGGVASAVDAIMAMTSRHAKTQASS